MDIDCLTELNNNINGQLTLRLGKLMEETTSIFWVPRIQIAQPTYDSTAGFRGMTDIPSVYYSTVLLRVLFHSDTVSIVTDYLAVGPSLVLGIWAVISDMYKTHLKHRQCLFY